MDHLSLDRNYKLQTKLKFSFAEIFIMFCILFLSDSLLFSTSTIRVFTLSRRIVPLLFVAWWLLKYRKIDKLLLIVCFCILFSLILNFESSHGFFYITQIGVLLFGFYYSKTINLEKFCTLFLLLFRIIVIVSLVGYFFSSLIKDINFIPVVENAVGVQFKTLFFTNIPLDSNLATRNWGPFWEPGCYQYYLNIGLILSIFTKNKYWKFDSILFGFTLLTTKSGASIVCVPFIFLAFLLDGTKRGVSKWVMAGILFSGGILLFIYQDSFQVILNKLSGDMTTSNSLYQRFSSVYACLRAFFQYPIYGAPQSEIIKITQETTSVISTSEYGGVTNTFVCFFAFFGIFVGCYLCYRVYKFTCNLSKNIISRILLFIAIFLTTANECLVQSLFLMVLLFIKSEYKCYFYE